MIDARKLDLIEKAKGIFTAEGYEVRRVGITSGLWSGEHRDRTIKHTLLLIKDAMQESEA